MSATTRDAMIDSTIVLLREKGLTGTSVRDVIEHSGAPRGSIYHHFPGGKAQMVDEAVERAGDAMTAAIEYFEREGDPAAAFDGLVAFFRDLLVASDFRAGCPIAAVSGEADTDELEASASAGRVFNAWRDRLARAAVARGVDPVRAVSLAALAIASLEGALLMSRATRSTEPLDQVRDEIQRVLEREFE